MLYQIRKMIAVALAVALGHVPPEVVPLTLHRPARFATPVAPAATLFLADAEFAPFTTAGRGPPAKNAAPKKGREGDGGASGVGDEHASDPNVPNRLETLAPGPETRAAIRRFRLEALEPSLAEALASDEWERFAENLFKLRLWARGEEGVRRIDALDEIMAKFDPYEEEMRAKREEKRTRRMAEEGEGEGREGGETKKGDTAGRSANDDKRTRLPGRRHSSHCTSSRRPRRICTRRGG